MDHHQMLNKPFFLLPMVLDDLLAAEMLLLELPALAMLESMPLLPVTPESMLLPPAMPE